MDRKVYFKNFIYGLFGGTILLLGWFVLDPIDDKDKNIAFALFITFDLILYPFSKVFIQKIAYLLLKKELWMKIRGNDISTPKLDALFSFICMMVAIPVGGCYAIYLLIRRWF